MLINRLLDLDLGAIISGLRWLRPNGCTVFPIYSADGAITNRRLAFLATAPLAFSEVPDVEPMVPYRVGDVFGITAEFEPMGDDEAIRAHVTERIAAAIDLLKRATGTNVERPNDPKET